MEEQTFKNYLHDLGTLIKENAREAKEKKDSSKGSSSQDYDSGYLMAWYEVVSLMQQQAEAFGIPFEFLDLHDIDPDKDLFRSRRKEMNILKQVKEILVEQNPQEKDNLLEQLSQVMENHHGLNETDVVEGVQILLSSALQENDKAVRETFFSTIENAVVHHDVGDRINWDTLAASLSSLEKWDLEYVLNVLGLSGQARYLPVLNEYAHHADPEIRKWAQEAITEIEYRVAHASPSQKAG